MYALKIKKKQIADGQQILEVLRFQNGSTDIVHIGYWIIHIEWDGEK